MIFNVKIVRSYKLILLPSALLTRTLSCVKIK